MSPHDRYRAVIIACGVFFVLSIAAMLLYPGGRIGDAGSAGYAFFTNFFSDLGQTATYGGHDNRSSLVLFCAALVAVAVGMMIFFITFRRLFATASRPAQIASTLATIAGCGAACCFLGVAATPWNLYLEAHNFVTTWAFQLFLVAVVCDGAAVLATRVVPNRFAFVYFGFAVVLAAYIALLVLGPRLHTEAGATIQATGQKVIVYASTLTILVQALLAQRLVTSRIG